MASLAFLRLHDGKERLQRVGGRLPGVLGGNRFGRWGNWFKDWRFLSPHVSFASRPP